MQHPESVTGRWLRDKPSYPARGQRRPVADKLLKRKRKQETLPSALHPWLTLTGASLNNLKNVSVRFPLGRFIVVTGVSGSGKSSLVKDCLFPAVHAALDKKSVANGKDSKRHRSLDGFAADRGGSPGFIAARAMFNVPKYSRVSGAKNCPLSWIKDVR